ncbi:MAG: tetratricopeptide repeat protein, partial [Myxococcota bacterium]
MNRLIVVSLVVAAGCTSEPAREIQTLGSARGLTPKSLAANASYANELKRLDTRIAAVKGQLVHLPTSTSRLSRLSSLYLSRSKLTGRYEDIDAAGEAVRKAFEVSPKGTGPFLARASWHATMHRFSEALADLERAQSGAGLSAERQASIASLRGNVLYNLGRNAEARRALEESVRLDRNPWALSRLALLSWKSGDFEIAEKLYDEAESGYHGREAEPRAWFHLIRGLMDLERNRLTDAIKHYEDAESAMPGWWLVREHIAEAKLRLG